MKKILISVAAAALLGGAFWAANQSKENADASAAENTPIVAATNHEDHEHAASSSPSAQDAVAAAEKETANAEPVTITKSFGQPLVLTLGKADAPVVIEEFASLSCSHCAHFEKDVLPQVKKNLIDSGKARLEMYSYLRNGPDLRGSMLLACLKDNDRRWKFAKVLFSMQDQWAFDEKFEESLNKIALVGGMSKTEFDGCMADKELENALIKQREAIDKERKIEGTPTFFINGKKLEGGPVLESFTKAIP